MFRRRGMKLDRSMTRCCQQCTAQALVSGRLVQQPQAQPLRLSLNKKKRCREMHIGSNKTIE